jgi:tetratricopeptide (TPR) repeat protein
MGDVDRAIADYTEAIRLDPKDAIAFLARGSAYSAKREFARAITNFDQALRLDAKSAAALNSRCWARAMIGQLDQALADCNESLRLSGDPYTLDSRGLVYLKLGRFDPAIADYTAVLKEIPEFADSLYGRGLAKRKKGDAAGGEADVAAAKALRPDVAEEFAKYGVK